MSKVFIEETTLTAIGDAIREKTGGIELIAPGNMPEEIRAIETGGGGSIEVDPVVLTLDCTSMCSTPFATTFIECFPDKVSTNSITNANSMFKGSTLTEIPFALNFSTTASNVDMRSLFASAEQLVKAPAMNNVKASGVGDMFYRNTHLQELPDGMENWDMTKVNTQTSGSHIQEMFCWCFAIKEIPSGFLKKLYNNASVTASYQASYTAYQNAFALCYALGEIRDLAVHPGTCNYNVFSSMVTECTRLSILTFDMTNPATPKTANWKNQVIDLSNHVGYAGDLKIVYNRPVGSGQIPVLPGYSTLTKETQITDDASYQALKQNSNRWTKKVEYSNYNHDSAVHTINSLPDTSAYVTTATTNVIKFLGESGSATDGGAINTLTEEEIAVAAAKGWTVTLV